MDHATFHVVYLDGRARFDRYETGGGGGVSGRMASDSGHAHHISKSQPSDVRSSLDSLLGFFQGGWWLSSDASSHARRWCMFPSLANPV
jgi:hypothetical protein